MSDRKSANGAMYVLCRAIETVTEAVDALSGSVEFARRAADAASVKKYEDALQKRFARLQDAVGRLDAAMIAPPGGLRRRRPPDRAEDQSDDLTGDAPTEASDEGR